MFLLLTFPLLTFNYGYERAKIMTWQEIREKYPNCWVLVEAFGATTENGMRVINTLIPLGEFGDDYKPAWDRYKALHQLARERELYVLHTNREELNIEVLDGFGRKLADAYQNTPH